MATTTPIDRASVDRRSPIEPAGTARSPLPLLGRLAAVAASWLILRPYLGIIHDALLYLHVAEFGRSEPFTRLDILVANDRQMDRSVFVPAVRPLVDAVGVATAAIATAIAGLIAWVAGISFLARVLVGRDWWIVAVGVPALGAYWGPLFLIGEPFATPRVFAEAAVMVALGLALGGRAGWSAAPAFVAMALHPIVGLTGLTVLVLILLVDRPRLIPFAAVAAAAAVALVAWDPLQFGGTAGFSAAWLAIIAERAGLVLPDEWPAVAWMRTGFGFAVVGSLYLTARPGPMRRLGGATILASAAGLATAIVFSWIWVRPFVTQLQPWRILWLLHLVAIIGVIVITLRAVRGTTAERVRALATWTLAFSMVLTGTPMLFWAVLVCALPLMLPHRGRVSELAADPRFVRGLAAFTILLGGIQLLVGSARIALVEPWDRIPWLAYGSRLPATTAILALALVLAALAVTRSGAVRLLGIVALVAALGFGMATWDHRSEWQAYGESLDEPIMDLPADAVVLVESDDLATATLFRRPTYYSNHAGAGVVFSEGLALEYTHHAEVARSLGIPFALNYRLEDIPYAERRTVPIGAAETACADPAGPTHLFLRRPVVDAPGIGWSAPVPIDDARDGEVNPAVIRDGFVLYACDDLVPSR